MSTHRYETRYECHVDCGKGGAPCPGHTLEVARHGGSDTTSILVDGKAWVTLDDHAFDALLEMMGASEPAPEAPSGAAGGVG